MFGEGGGKGRGQTCQPVQRRIVRRSLDQVTKLKHEVRKLLQENRIVTIFLYYINLKTTYSPQRLEVRG